MKFFIAGIAFVFIFIIGAHKAEAAITYVGGASATGNTGTITLSLTSLTGGSNTSPSVGDIVIVVNAFVSTADGNPGVTTAGYTEVSDLYDSDSDDTNLSVNYKVMTGSADTSVVCNGSTSTSWGNVCMAYVWRGIDTSTPLDVTTTTATPGNNPNTSIPNAPSITPVTAGALVVAVGAGADASADTAVTAPTGYTNQINASVDPSLAIIAAIASKSWGGSGAEDPAAWTGWTSTTAGSWAATTLALRPAPTISGTSNGTGTVRYAINNTLQSQTGTISGGAWSIATSGIPAGAVITVWIDGAASNAAKSTAVTKYSSGDATGMVLNTQTLTIGSSENTSVSATNLDQYDCSADADVMHSVTSGALNVEGTSCAGATNNSFTGETLSVLSGNTFTLASASTETLTTEKISNAGTITASGTPTLTLGGTSGTLFTNSGTFTSGSSKIIVNGAGTTTLLSAATTLYDLQINNASAAVTLGANTTISDILTLDAGSLQLGTSNFSVWWADLNGGTLDDSSATGTNTVTNGIDLAGGTWTSTGNSNYLFNGSLYVSAGSTFSSGTGTYTFSSTSAQDISGGGSTTFAAGSTIVNSVTSTSGVAITGFSSVGTVTQSANAVLYFTGSVPTVTALNATASGNSVVYSGTSAQTVIPTTYYDFTVNKASGTATLGGAGLVITHDFWLTAGTFDANNQNLTTRDFLGSNSNTRAIVMGSGTWTLTGTGSGVWNTNTTTGFTVTPGTSTIKLTDSSVALKSFWGGGKTYNNIWYAPGAGTGSFEITGSNTFNDFKDDGTASHSILFTAGSTTTVSTFTVTGNATHTITINSSDGSGNASTLVHNLVKTGGGTVSSDYLNIQHSVATPSSTWYAGTNSTDNQATADAGSGWTFTAATNDGLPYGGTAWSIPGTIQAEDFNTGGEGVGYHDADPSNAAGQYRPSEGVDIEAVQNDTGSYDVGWISAGEWLKYTINVTTTDTYVFNMRAASPSSGGQFQIEVDGSVLGTGTVPQTGSYQAWQTVAVPNISLTAGQHILRIIIGASPNYNLNYFNISNNISPTVNAGTDQSITLPTSSTTLTGTASDSDGTIASYAWSEQFGPNNATFGSQTSASTTISGLIEGSYIFRLTVTDNGGATAYDDVNVVVNPDLSTTTYYVDFGLSTIQTSTTGWNNLSDTTTSGPTLTLVDSTGATTTRTLHITDSFYYNSGVGMDSSMNQNGTSSSTIYPANATHDSFFLGTLNSITDTSAQVTVGGLNNANTYDFKFYASRVAGDAGNRTTDYTIGATTVSLNATDNVDTTVQITGVSPSSGSVVININKNASASFGYLGALQITEHSAGNASPTANAGNDQSVTMPVSSITLSGSGSDTDGTIASYAWSEVSTNYATINSPSSATTTVKDLAAGTYTFRLTVTDNQGATGTDDVVVTVASHNLTTPTAKTIVILGSSTSAGYGLTPASDAYANRFSAYFDGLVTSNNVINLAVSGYTTYQILPTGSSTANRPAPDTAHNITQALTYSPAAILVNMPSNDTANGYAVSEQETNFQTLASTAAAAGVPIYFTTTQPRNNFTAGQVTDQTTVRDWILSTYGTNAIDFWTTFAQGDGTINPIYDQGDGIHLNNVAHKKLYARVAESTMINAAHNISPTANAGVDQSIYLPTTTTTLSGSGSDTDGTIASYAWSFISGPVTPTISSASTASTGISGLSNTGTYVFRLTVADNFGKTGTDDISVVVNPVSTGCVSQGTGSWNTTGTWSCGHVPTTGDDVTVASGHTISVDVDPATLGAITVNGTLNAGSHTVAGSSLTIGASGTFNTGASAVTISGDISNSGTFSTSSWQNYRAITVDHTKVPNTDLTDFPMLINGTYTYLKTSGNGGKVTNANGYDIAFFSDASLTTPLKFEREKWSASTGDLIAWVKIPTLSHTTDTTIYMAYGNSTIATDQADKTNVWDSNYKAVWHLNESFTGNGQTLANSTSYAEDLTTHSTSSTYSGGQISGPVGYGISNIKATNDYLSFPQVTLSGAWTLEGWVKVGYTDQYSSLISNGSTGGGLIYNTNWYAGLFRMWDGTTDNIVADTAISAGAWNHFVVTRSGTALAMYIGGNPHGTSANGKNAIFQYLAMDGNGNPSTDLQFDEVRLSTAQRSADWVKTEYNNQNSPSTFYSVGVEQSVSAGTNLTVSLSGSWTNTGTFSGGNATIKMTDNSGNPTFAGGGATYNKLWLAPGTGTGSYTISGNNTFTELKDDGTAAHTIKFSAGSTQTLTTWNVSGTSGNLITIDSTTTGVHNLVKPNDAPEVRADYLSIKHSVATPYDEWYAGENSVDNQNLASAGSGWVFTTRSKHRSGGGSVRSAGGETDNGTGTGTCADQIQNGNETGVDSGGRCANTGGGAGGGGTVDNGTGTGTCSDGIKNGDETGIDTGGRCANTGGGSGGGGGDVGFLFFFQQITLPSMNMWFAFR